jgi:hypothetical protein
VPQQPLLCWSSVGGSFAVNSTIHFSSSALLRITRAG